LLLTNGTDEQIKHVSPVTMDITEKIDVQIGSWTQLNTRFMSRVDPGRAALHQSARKPIFKRFIERAARNELRWVGTAYPTNASAQDAEMSLTEYEDFVFTAGLL